MRIKSEMKKNNKFIGAGVLTAIAASLCCITPVLALMAGSSGIASVFSWMDPFRPYLIGLTVLLIGFAWYQKLKPQKTDDCICDTAEKQKFIQTKSFLGIVTVFTALMIAFPYYSKIFYPENKSKLIIVDKAPTHQATLKIKGMTCEACEEHVKHEVNKLAGILTLSVSYTNRNALITFDTTQTNIKEIEKAVEKTGYKITESILK